MHGIKVANFVALYHLVFLSLRIKQVRDEDNITSATESYEGAAKLVFRSDHSDSDVEKRLFQNDMYDFTLSLVVMKQVTVNIPDGKFEFFMELFRSLGITADHDMISEIPQWQKDLTLKRLAELEKDPSKAIDFDSMINRLEDKHGL
ncbi:MAG: hypothetical protein ACI837_001891 [Crocinitomicaceae bacterium]|jgi:hypothetical protein